jgi:predicted metalloprotease with PDZ domain
MKNGLAGWLFAACLLALAPAAAVRAQPSSMAPTITYTLSMPQPHTHYFVVDVHLSGLQTPAYRQQGYVEVKLPVWTPGSYLIREYAKNVERFEAKSGTQSLPVEKTTKNTWRIRHAGATDVTLTYTVYANELTVRTSYLDAQQGYVNGASLFVYLPEHQQVPATLTVRPPAGWRVTTALEPLPGQPNQFRVPHYDLLVDSPLQMGTHRVLTFEAAGVPHQIAMVGTHAPVDEARLLADYRRVCEAATSVVGEHPCPSYTFLVQHLPTGGGGLEHLNSTSLQTSRQAYASEAGYTGFLGLVAHEYFHLWNVKRIRPNELGPFDYDNENYTRMLWVAEGITSMYDNYILRRAGVTTVERYLADVAADFNYTENTPGSRVQSLADASWDAWIKYYRPNENSGNSTVSYYSKGAAVTTLLNLEILHQTKGQKSLDDVMRYLWAEYYKKQQRGFTEAELQRALEAATGTSLETFFREYIHGTVPLDFNRYLGYVGCRVVDQQADSAEPFLGAAFVGNAAATGKLVVSTIHRDSPAWNDGLNANDELVSINGKKPALPPAKLLEGYRIGDKVTIQVLRAGLPQTLTTTLVKDPRKAFRIERTAQPTAGQEALYRKWLYIND